MPEVVATILIELNWSQMVMEEIESDRYSNYIVVFLSDLWHIKCYTKEEVFDRVKSLQELTGVHKITIVYGDSNWMKYTGSADLFSAEKTLEKETKAL